MSAAIDLTPTPHDNAALPPASEALELLRACIAAGRRCGVSAMSIELLNRCSATAQAFLVATETDDVAAFLKNVDFARLAYEPATVALLTGP